MKQFLSVLVAIIFIIALVLNQALPADAAKSKNSKKKGVSQEVLTDINTKLNDLTNKIYRREFFTPEDATQLSSLKLQLDDQMDIMPEATFAPLYYKLANIYRLRGKQEEAVICYQTILENFIDTAYGPKSRDILQSMGIEIKLPSSGEEEDLEE